MTGPDKRQGGLAPHHVWLTLCIAVALGYLFGLGGDHIPRNGDELVYVHIARLTAESGHWLPLVSSFDFMRNTKPPLLFWQAMVAGGWGEHWTLLNLRLPSLFYSWAIAAMVGLLTSKILLDAIALPSSSSTRSGQPFTAQRQQAIAMGAIAAIVYLSFFSTYRFGRPYLTSAPETFWLFGVFFVIAWTPARRLASRWAFPLLAGLAIGVGSLFKSFAMIAPVGLALALCYQVLHARKAPWHIFRPGIVTDGFKLAGICTIALAVFGLWFALDPQPGEVWREFVVGENAGKFKSSPGYFKQAVSGSGGVVVILTGYFVNAGLLLPVTAGCAWAAWRNYRQRRATDETLSDAEKVLWLWLLALALVFMVPSQRSARYLIPAMPAVAILVGLYWSRIGRIWFGVTLLFCLAGVLAMASIAYGAVRATQDPWLYSPLYWTFLAVIGATCLAGTVKPALSRPMAALAGFAVLLSLAWTTEPFNGPLGRFKPATEALLQGQTVAVPSNFNGQFERYQFLIRGATVLPYFAAQPVDYNDIDALFKNARYALVQRRMGESPCEKCRIVDVRWDLRSRQSEGTLAAFKHPETFWYAKEYLVERLAP